MTENEKAKELIATSETTVKVDPQNGWYREKELDVHGIPTGRTYKACSCLLCNSCGHKETVDGSFDEPYK